jgi:predicted transcriptional regulator
MPDVPPLSKRETQIMDIVYAIGEATASQVMERMPDDLSRAAVRTFLRILEEKGHLTHRQVGRHYVFKPVQGKQRAGEGALRRVLDVFYGGSLEEAVAAYLAKRGDVDLQKMAELINQARKEGR